MKRILMFIMLAGHAVAGAQSDWSGEVVFDVNPLHTSKSQWDYIPHTIIYQTNGERWRVLEQGTSFERVWIGEHAAPEHHILFHFLGHAVELESSCSAKRTPQFKWGLAPCPWSTDALGEKLFVQDGPVQYALTERSLHTVKHSDWDRKHFHLPGGYEPMDKPGLSALLQSLGQTRH
ncbi:MAG: hypothetical protein CL828_00290 [Crocinitomicaceae bacterium]|nr:hypothetical protein [Crocinitomicaceae bacterium]